MGMCTPSQRPAVTVTTAAQGVQVRNMKGVVVPSRLRSNRAATAEVFVDLARGLADASATAVGHVMDFALSPVLPSPVPLTTPTREGAGGDAYAVAYRKAAATMAEGWAAALEAESESYAEATTNDEAAVTLRAVMHAAVQDMELALADIPPYCEGRA